MAPMVLVLGGVRSGKSSWTADRATRREKAGLGRCAYIATAQAGDEEMAERIRRHRTDRPPGWITVEAPLDPAAALDELAADVGTVILDCLTLWITNLLAPFGEEPDREKSSRLVEEAVDNLGRSLADWESGARGGDRLALVVSNQVENGLISPWPLGRLFQELCGRAHQELAKRAGEVRLMNAGIAQRIK